MFFFNLQDVNQFGFLVITKKTDDLFHLLL